MRSSRPFVLVGTALRVPFLPMNWIISSLITLAILVPAFLVILGINRQERAARLEADGRQLCLRAAPRLPAARGRHDHACAGFGLLFRLRARRSHHVRTGLLRIGDEST